MPFVSELLPYRASDDALGVLEAKVGKVAAVEDAVAVGLEGCKNRERRKSGRDPCLDDARRLAVPDEEIEQREIRRTCELRTRCLNFVQKTDAHGLRKRRSLVPKVRRNGPHHT